MWIKDLNKTERSTMAGCFLGWTLDALDVQIFSFVIPTLLLTWHISPSQAGVLGTVTLLVSAVGGWLSGFAADRFGRVRVLQVTVLWYAFFTFLTGFAHNYEQLFICRALQGFGFGGEWATGAVLIAEVVRKEYRGRSLGVVQSGWAVGWGLAALLFGLFFSFMPEDLAWRSLFWIGLSPALLIFWVRRHVQSLTFMSSSNEAVKRKLEWEAFWQFSPQRILRRPCVFRHSRLALSAAHTHSSSGCPPTLKRLAVFR